MTKRPGWMTIAFMIAVLILTSGCISKNPGPGSRETLAAPSPSKKPDAPYISTPGHIVEEMLDMARVGPEDIIYDLGCGDGRIVVTAASKCGARGVGVDISPALIQKSLKNAARARVTDRVRFIEGDLFEVDFSSASVLSLYLLPSLNLKLRPKIFTVLKPGARILSHNFDMGDWEPDNFKSIGEHRIYYWVVPASASGIWEMHWDDETGMPSILNIRQEFQMISGTLTSGNPQAIKNGRLVGDTIQFTAVRKTNGKSVRMRFEGRVNGHAIEGTFSVLGLSGKKKWTAERDPASVQPIHRPVP
jgi:SAM-dependent methyltransferase